MYGKFPPWRKSTNIANREAFQKTGRLIVLLRAQKQEKPYHRIATLIWLLVKPIVTNPSLPMQGKDITTLRL
jgi:hypothetical protein